MPTVVMTYQQIAERLGISVDGARMKAKRQGWPKTKGNDGAMRITVDESELVASNRSQNVGGTFPDQLAEQIRMLTEQLAKAESRADEERERVADLTAQLLQITHHLSRPWWRRLVE